MNSTSSRSNDPLDEIIGAYLHAQEQGDPPPRDELLRQHPDLAAELREFFANQDRLNAAAGGLPGELPRRQFVPPRVRYFGDYELLDEIARGGMGVVYRAKQTSLNRIVAIKMILSGHLASEEDVKRFHSEAEAAASLKHPGIVPVHEVGVHDGHHYFSMDYIAGRSLAEIARDGPVPAQRAAEYVRAIAQAVHYAHQQGMLHRDLKPSNILIDAEDHVHVTDFGLALRVEGDSELTRTGQILGTPAYMPPEQAQGKRGLCGPGSDVYSLGAILYELLSGRPPFKCPSSAELLQQVIEQEPVALRTLNAQIPRDLETICLKCLRKEPSRRYHAASALAEDLGRFLSCEPITGRPVSRTEKFWLWCRRRPAIAGFVAIVLVTACSVGGLIVAERQRSLRHRVEAAVASMGTAHGDLVPDAIEKLGRFPQQMVLAELRRQVETADGARKLPLACALAHFGGAPIEFLIRSVKDAAPDEVENLVAALGHSRAEAVAALKAAAQAAESEEDWRYKARLTVLLLHLDELSAARQMCELRSDPVQRTWFIEECSTWHGDLRTLAQVAAGSDDAPFRTGVAQAAGSAPAADLTHSVKQAWQMVFSNWHASEPDALTHNTAGWALRRWNVEEPPSPLHQIDGGWQINSIGMTMVDIRAGAYVRNSLTRRRGQCVLLTRPFLLGDREVTRAQFRQFIDTCPEEEKPRDWEGPSLEVSPTVRHPVQRVNWYDAIQFCNWLSRREALTPCYAPAGETEGTNDAGQEVWRLNPDADGYRLPTEAEWEYACRAGTATLFYHGDEKELLNRYAVYDVEWTELPGSKLPNYWGLFDMHGNLWEWCDDWYGQYDSGLLLRNPGGPVRGVERVTRGGSCVSSSKLTSFTSRSHFSPDVRQTNIGFRVARWHGSPAVDAVDPPVYQTLIELLSHYVAVQPTDWQLTYELASLQQFVGDEQVYHETCRQMLSRLVQSKTANGRHELLFAHLFFPSGEVTDEILDLARQHARDGRPANVRMLGLAFYRRRADQQALPLLEEAAAGRLAGDSRITSLLCLALVKLRMNRLEEARNAIREARKVQENSSEECNSPHRQPWGAISSLWREVRAAMELVGVDEAIPELPSANL